MRQSYYEPQELGSVKKIGDTYYVLVESLGSEWVEVNSNRLGLDYTRYDYRLEAVSQSVGEALEEAESIRAWKSLNGKMKMLVKFHNKDAFKAKFGSKAKWDAESKSWFVLNPSLEEFKAHHGSMEWFH